MQVEIVKLASKPIFVEIPEGGTVRNAFDAPNSGAILGHDDISLIKAAERIHGDDGVEAMGSIRVNGAPASLDTTVTANATIMIVPKVEGGL